MIDGMRVLGLIPARGGSKGVPGKNVKELCGKPLIAYSIEGALASRYLDAVVVSTDDEEIAVVSREFGAEVPFMRPAELASDTSKTIDCVIHALDALAELGRSFDVVVLLQPTSPLRTTADIDGSLEFFLAKGKRGVVSVSEAAESPILYRTIDSEGVLTHLLNMSSTVRRQDMPAYYRVNGCLFVNGVSELSPNTSLNDNPMGYIVSSRSGVDVDSLEDFQEAERYLAR